MRVVCTKSFLPFYDDGPKVGDICDVVEMETGTCDCGGDCYVLAGYGENFWCAGCFDVLSDHTPESLLAEIS